MKVDYRKELAVKKAIWFDHIATQMNLIPDVDLKSLIFEALEDVEFFEKELLKHKLENNNE